MKNRVILIVLALLFLPIYRVTIISFAKELDSSDEFTITIDAEKDPWYESLMGPEDGYIRIPFTALANPFAPPDNEQDLSAQVWLSWDEEYFYFFIEVWDDTILVNNALAYNNDAIEIKFDPDPLTETLLWPPSCSITALGEDDADVVEGVYYPGKGSFDFGDPFEAVEGVDYARKMTSKGYNIECRLPWTIIRRDDERVILNIESSIGLAINILDNDDFERSTMLQWSAGMDDHVWDDPLLHGTATFLSDHKFKMEPVNSAGGPEAVADPNWFKPIATNAQISKGNFEFEGKTREYIVYLPENFQTNMPVVFNLAGYTTDAMWQMDYSLMNQVADTAGFILVYPNPLLPGFNSGIAENPGWDTPDVDDVGFIDALIDTLYNRYNVDLARIYVCGFSNGGIMSYKLACQLSDRIAAIASVSGIISFSTLDNCNSSRPMPVLQIHGTADGLVPLEGATGWNSVDSTLNYWIHFNDCAQVDTIHLPDIDPTDGCRVEKISYSDCSGGSKVIFYKVNDGGHCWPSAAIEYSWQGTRTKDINANVEIWNFFKNYELEFPALIEEEFINSKDFNLKQNYPNPFNPSTAIEFTIPVAGEVKLSVFDLLGRKVRTLLNGRVDAGVHSIQFDGSHLSSGIYLYRLRAGDQVLTRKLMLIK